MENKDNIDTIIAKYGQRVPKKPRKGPVVAASIIILLVIIAVTLGILMLVKNNVQMVAPMLPVTQSTNGPSPKDVADKIAADATIAAAANYFVTRTNATQPDAHTDTSFVIYKHAGYNFLTTVSAEDGLHFTLVNAKAVSNKGAITTAIQNVLKAEGFTAATQDTSSLSSYAVTSYINNGTVCQLVDYVSEKQKTLEQGVLCNSDKSLDEGYKNVQSLLAKVDPAAAQNAATVHQDIITDGTKRLLTLTVKPQGSEKTTAYYFATLSKDYEYIGSRPTPSVDDEASYALSDQLKKSIADPKWGTFLSDNIK